MLGMLDRSRFMLVEDKGHFIRIWSMILLHLLQKVNLVEKEA